MRSINPANGETIAEYEPYSTAEIGRRIDTAAARFREWRRVPVADRMAPLRAAARILRERREELARLMALEMGKPVVEGRGEIDKCAWVCEYYAEEAAGHLAPEAIATDAQESAVVFEPLGVVLAVMPWNFPFWQVFRFAVPAIAAGNGALLKHASNVSGCSLAIEEVWEESGLPAGLFSSLLVESSRVDDILGHDEVAAVSLTGSTPAGQAVAARAGALLKKCVLELGGSDPYLVMEDADLERAAETCATARLINGGQSCIAAKRLIVHEAVEEDFRELLEREMERRVVGDPLEEDTQIGPMARHDLRDELHRQVAASLEAGARCTLGGEPPEGPGAYYPPTVLAGVEPGMAAFDEELFGPVAAVIRAESEEEAIRLANASPFGLGAAVFTRDEVRGREIATKRLEAGSCFVNAFVRSDPRLPFGGVKQSGFGRELGMYGIREFVNVKTVWVG